jgi:hypothetical protein
MMRKKKLQKKKENLGEKKFLDFVEILLNAEEDENSDENSNKLSNEEILDEVNTFMVSKC